MFVCVNAVKDFDAVCALSREFSCHGNGASTQLLAWQAVTFISSLAAVFTVFR